MGSDPGAAERMRRHRATPEGRAKTLARARALGRLKDRHPREFDELEAEEYAKALAEERRKG